MVSWMQAMVTNVRSVSARFQLRSSLKHREFLSPRARGTDTLVRLLGRLRGSSGTSIETLLGCAQQGPGRLWLHLRSASLTAPGGPLRQILVGHRSGVFAVAFLPDGSRALSSSLDNTLRLWDLATGETLRILEGHRRPGYNRARARSKRSPSSSPRVE
jgi:WD40 repeat protein